MMTKLSLTINQKPAILKQNNPVTNIVYDELGMLFERHYNRPIIRPISDSLHRQTLKH